MYSYLWHEEIREWSRCFYIIIFIILFQINKPCCCVSRSLLPIEEFWNWNEEHNHAFSFLSLCLKTVLDLLPFHHHGLLRWGMVASTTKVDGSPDSSRCSEIQCWRGGSAYGYWMGCIFVVVFTMEPVKFFWNRNHVNLYLTGYVCFWNLFHFTSHAYERLITNSVFWNVFHSLHFIKAYLFQNEVVKFLRVYHFS